ncbi:hypothetical protein AHAS_Ahas09G0192200 [Arachis hypogaea]
MRVLSAVQVRPHVKWVRRGTEHGSVVKFQDAMHDHGVIEEGSIEALKAFSASMSEDEVRPYATSLWHSGFEMRVLLSSSLVGGVLRSEVPDLKLSWIIADILRQESQSCNAAICKWKLPFFLKIYQVSSLLQCPRPSLSPHKRMRLFKGFKIWDLIEILCWRYSLHATKTRTWQPTVFWITRMNLKTKKMVLFHLHQLCFFDVVAYHLNSLEKWQCQYLFA